MSSRAPSRTLCSLLETVMACPLPQKDWATLLHTCHRYRYLLVTKHFATNNLLPTISVPAEITLLKSACHFLLLLVGLGGGLGNEKVPLRLPIQLQRTMHDGEGLLLQLLVHHTSTSRLQSETMHIRVASNKTIHVRLVINK